MTGVNPVGGAASEVFALMAGEQPTSTDDAASFDALVAQAVAMLALPQVMPQQAGAPGEAQVSPAGDAVATALSVLQSDLALWTLVAPPAQPAANQARVAEMGVPPAASAVDGSALPLALPTLSEGTALAPLGAATASAAPAVAALPSNAVDEATSGSGMAQAQRPSIDAPAALDELPAPRAADAPVVTPEDAPRRADRPAAEAPAMTGRPAPAETLPAAEAPATASGVVRSRAAPDAPGASAAAAPAKPEPSAGAPAVQSGGPFGARSDAASAGEAMPRSSTEGDAGQQSVRQEMQPAARVDVPTAGHASAHTAASTPAESAAAPRPALFGQVVRAVQMLQARGHSEVYLRLDPPELGELHIRLAVVDDHVQVHLRTASGEVKSLLDTGVVQLRQALADLGLRVEGLHVSLGQGGGPGLGAESGGGPWQGAGWRAGHAGGWMPEDESAPQPQALLRQGDHAVDYRV